MVLVDTSVWVEYLRSGANGLDALLTAGEVVCHPFVIGELACGDLDPRDEILCLLHRLPHGVRAGDDEVLEFIDNFGLMGKGLGYVDIHLLMSAMLTGIPLWTVDKRLEKISLEILPFRIASPPHQRGHAE